MKRPPGFNIFLAVLLAGVLPCLASLAARHFFGAVPRPHEGIHESLEMAGTFIALGVAMLLLLRLRHEDSSPHLLWVVLGLVAMGSADGAHAVLPFGYAWSWLRHGSTFAGGILFALVWFPLRPALLRRAPVLTAAAAALALAAATVVWWASPVLPAPWFGNGYSLEVKAVNALGGLGFLSAAVFFLARYRRNGLPENVVLAGHTMLFATAGLMFGFSDLWAPDWWVWHAARLVAYAILLAAAHQTVSGLYERLDRHAHDLEQSVAERTASLTRSETRLRRSEQTFSELIERAPFGVYVVDSNFRIAVMNAGSQERAFRSVRPAIGRDFGEAMRIVWPEPIAAEIVAIFRRTLETGEPYYSSRFMSSRRDIDAVEAYEWQLERMTLPDGQYAVICYYFDSTQLRSAEEALRRSEARWTAAIENFEEGVIIATEAEQVVYWNPAARRLYGLHSGADGLGSLADAALALELRTPAGELLDLDRWPMRRIKRGEPVHNCELRLSRPGQDWEKIVLYSGAMVETAAGERLIFLSVHDVTEQRRAEQAARQHDEALRRLVESNILGVVTADMKGVKTANDIFLAIIGATRQDLEAGRVDWVKATPPEHLEKDLRALEQLRSRGWCSPYEKEYVHPDGVRVPLLIGAAALRTDPLEWICFALDLTERKALERRLRETQKLESIGILAGGIAHDFNNLLVGVMGNASLAEDMLPHASSVRPIIAEVLKAAERAAHLTRELLAYSGKGRFVLEPVDLSEAVRDVTSLIRSSIPARVAVQFDLAPGLPAVEADPAQIQQLLMNLVLNGAEAIGDNPGVLTLRTRLRILDSAPSEPEFAGLSLDGYISVQVSDTGCGMDEDVKAKIFDPFFTTKFTGRGLGLAAVSGIVRGHRGAIRVESAPGRGTTFEVLLPASAAVKPAPPRELPAAPATCGAGTVLIVDDEEVVLRAAAATLERQGYTVLCADSGQAALDLLSANGNPFSAVLLDLSMPGMDGAETLRRLRRLHPRLPVLISSGYSETECLQLFAGERVSGFVQKPYTAKLLAEKIGAALSAGPEPPSRS